MKGKLIIFMMLVLSLSFVSSAKISCPFDVSQNMSCGNTGITYSGSLVFEVTTSLDVLCRFGTSQSTSYNAMSQFVDNFYTIHKKEFTSLSDGVYTYYVKCRNISNINNDLDGVNALSVVFKISNPIAANIVLSNSPLTGGKYEINVVTTKVPMTTPKLSYSYDAIVYSPIVLHGAGTNWQGYLIIPDSPDEKVGSFKFEATDLEGRTGNEIYGNDVFLVDTLPPRVINNLNAVGEYGSISLEWVLNKDDDVDKINIYRSQEPNVDLTELYKTVDGTDKDYTDTDVENGKTYYYRISPEDKAGNLAQLSKELKATALTSQVQKTSSGLAPELFGKVDAVIVQADMLLESISNSEMTFNAKSQDVEILKALGVFDAISSSKSELNAVKNTLESLKSQDLSESTLDSRLSSNEVKINILKKKIPESYSLATEKLDQQNPSDESLRVSILDKVPDLSSSLLDGSVKKSLSLIKENNVKISSQLNIVETTYLDGSRESKSLIQHRIDSTLEPSQNIFLLLRLPSGNFDANTIHMKNADYQKEKDSLISFSASTKNIIYSVDKALDKETLSSITIVPALILEEGTPLTGYFLSELTSTSSWTTVLVIIILGMIGYLFYMRKSRLTPSSSDFIMKARRVKEFHSQGKTLEANSLYESLKNDYISLSPQEKSKVFNEVKHLGK